MVSFCFGKGCHTIMGVLNVTPDSFSDGGQFLDVDRAVARGFEMYEEGADIIDVGGESTRPGAEPVSVEEEIARTVPVIKRLYGRGLSIDTSKPEVAAACLQAGAGVVNDVRALTDDGMMQVCADHICSVCLMHMQGDPRSMQSDPQYGDVVMEVRDYLARRADCAMSAGISEDRICVDPGFGFGKTLEHNLVLLRRLDEIVALGFPVMVGTSRKSFIGKALNQHNVLLPVEERLEGTIATNVIAQMKGADVFRVHDVKEAVRASQIASAVLNQGPGT